MVLGYTEAIPATEQKRRRGKQHFNHWHGFHPSFDCNFMCFFFLSFMDIKTPSLSSRNLTNRKYDKQKKKKKSKTKLICLTALLSHFTLSVFVTTEISRMEIPTIRGTPGDVGLLNEEDTRWKHAWERRSAMRRWRRADTGGTHRLRSWAENTMWRQGEPVLLLDLHQNYPQLGISFWIPPADGRISANTLLSRVVRNASLSFVF